MLKNTCLCASTVLLSASVFAAEPLVLQSSTHSSTQPMSAYEVAQTRMITPSAVPIPKDGCDFFMDFDFIYWTSRLDEPGHVRTNTHGGDFGLLLGPGVDVDAATRTRGSTFRGNNKYSPGWKAGAGVAFEPDGWDLYLQYTWFHNKPKKGVYDGSGGGIGEALGFFKHPFLDITEEKSVSRGETTYSLFFNNFDLELGRNFYISKRLQLRPHFGLKGSWYTLRQRNHYYFQGFFESETDTDLYLDWDDFIHNSRNKQKYWGVGIRGGLDTSWMFSKNWSIYGDLALATEWCKYNISKTERQIALEFGTDTDETEINIEVEWDGAKSSDSKHSLTPILELALGLRYDYYWDNDDYRFRLQAGWEQQVWWDQYQFISTWGQTRHSGNLVFQGLTVEARFDF